MKIFLTFLALFTSVSAFSSDFLSPKEEIGVHYYEGEIPVLGLSDFERVSEAPATIVDYMIDEVFVAYLVERDGEKAILINDALVTTLPIFVEENQCLSKCGASAWLVQ